MIPATFEAARLKAIAAAPTLQEKIPFLSKKHARCSPTVARLVFSCGRQESAPLLFRQELPSLSSGTRASIHVCFQADIIAAALSHANRAHFSGAFTPLHVFCFVLSLQEIAVVFHAFASVYPVPKLAIKK